MSGESGTQNLVRARAHRREPCRTHRIHALSFDRVAQDPDAVAEHPKSEEEIASIRTVISQCFLFAHLDEDALNRTALAMFKVRTREVLRVERARHAAHEWDSKRKAVRCCPRTADASWLDRGGRRGCFDDQPPDRSSPSFAGQVEKQAGEVIIRQADIEAEYFYVVESGECKCYQGAHDENGLVGVCTPGDGFGELALMYSQPRQASVVADTDVSLWALDRSSFRVLLMQAALDRRQRHKDFLDNVSVFTVLSTYQTLLIADAMEDVDYEDGQVIFNQGDQSEDFYLVQEGEVVVSQVHGAPGTTGDTLEPEPEPAVDGGGAAGGGVLLTLHRGEYFGWVLASSSRSQAAFAGLNCILTVPLSARWLVVQGTRAAAQQTSAGDVQGARSHQGGQGLQGDLPEGAAESGQPA